MVSCILLSGIAGCSTVAEKNESAAVIVDGDKYVTMDAPVGSHMKRRVRVSDISKPGISPTRKDIVTADTDTHLLPPTAQEMERMITDRPTGP